MGNPTKAELEWYGSDEHFRSEKSYKEHLEDLKKEIKKKKEMKGLGLPSFKDLMRM